MRKDEGVLSASKSCQNKKASLKLYLDIKALAHSDFFQVCFIFLVIQICHQHGVYTKDHV